MDLSTQAGTNAAIAQAQQRGQQLQQQYDVQSQQAQGQYQQTYNQAQQDRAQAEQAQQALAGYQVKSGGDLYNQYLTAAQQQYGFDPRSLAAAQKQLLGTQVAMQYAPSAAQQAGNYYGATAGQAQQAYQNMAQNLNTTLANQTNKVQSFQNLLQATQQQAQQQTGAETTTQGQRIGQLQASAQNATNVFNAATQQMQAASSTMVEIEKLQQNQGFATAQQVATYQNAYNDYLKAKAEQAKAAAEGLSAQAAMLQAQTYANMVNGLKTGGQQGGQLFMGSLQQYGATLKNPGQYGSGYNFAINNKPATAAVFAQTYGIPLVDMLNSMGNTGDKYAGAAGKALAASGGNITPALINQYPAIFGNASGPTKPSLTTGGINIQPDFRSFNPQVTRR